MAFAKDRGKIKSNPCERGGRLYSAKRAEIIWTEEDIAAFCGVAPRPLQEALMLALWTGQRQGDLLALTWGTYDGRVIRLTQSKTGRRVVIPVGGPLRDLLDALKARRTRTDGDKLAATTILVNTEGKPWTSSGFRASWGKAAIRAEVDRHFHDLRGTAVTRLALAGCTVPEIGSITGHSLGDAAAILEANYLGGRTELAEAAVAKLNAAFGT